LNYDCAGGFDYMVAGWSADGSSRFRCHHRRLTMSTSGGTNRHHRHYGGSGLGVLGSLVPSRRPDGSNLPYAG
jgi:hypothetical protein